MSDQNRMMMEFSARVDALARVVRDAWSDPDVKCPDWPTLRHVCVLALIDGRGETLAALGHDDCVPREYVDMRVSDATEQHARDAEQQHDRAKRAEAERDRYREALQRIYQSGTGRHVEIARAALDGGDGDG